LPQVESKKEPTKEKKNKITQTSNALQKLTKREQRRKISVSSLWIFFCGERDERDEERRRVGTCLCKEWLFKLFGPRGMRRDCWFLALPTACKLK